MGAAKFSRPAHISMGRGDAGAYSKLPFSHSLLLLAQSVEKRDTMMVVRELGNDAPTNLQSISQDIRVEIASHI